MRGKCHADASLAGLSKTRIAPRPSRQAQIEGPPSSDFGAASEEDKVQKAATENGKWQKWQENLVARPRSGGDTVSGGKLDNSG